MKSKFSKSDLKTGMTVENRIGQKGKVLVGTSEGDIVGGVNGDKNEMWCPLDRINDNLTHQGGKPYDIIKVWNITDNKQAASIEPNGPLLWERQDVPEFVELLKSSFGYQKGDIAKVVSLYDRWYGCSVPNRKSTINRNTQVVYSPVDTKPATKEQFEAQQAEFNKPKELIAGQIYFNNKKAYPWTDVYAKLFRHKFSVLYSNGNFEDIENCFIDKATLATPELSAELVRNELDHGWYWNGTDLVKI